MREESGGEIRVNWTETVAVGAIKLLLLEEFKVELFEEIGANNVENKNSNNDRLRIQWESIGIEESETPRKYGKINNKRDSEDESTVNNNRNNCKIFNFNGKYSTE